MHQAVAETIGRLAGAPPRAMTPLGGGCIGDVFRVDFAGRAPLVAKVGDRGSGLVLEGFMLRYLARHSRLPVPQVVHTPRTGCC